MGEARRKPITTSLARMSQVYLLKKARHYLLLGCVLQATIGGAFRGRLLGRRPQTELLVRCLFLGDFVVSFAALLKVV